MRTSGANLYTASHLRRIEAYPELDREQELALARRYLDGADARAGELLICAHLRDVVAIARGYLGYGQPFMDLIAAGSVGLVHALARFDPARGLRFMTYAGYWVRAEILLQVLSSWSVVGVGKSSPQIRLFFGLRRERARLEARGYADEALVEALAARFCCSTDRVLAMQQRLDRRDGSLDFIEHHAAPDADPEHALAHKEWSLALREQLEHALAHLDERERVIIERRLIDEHPPTLVELGEQLGLSRERVRQLEGRARTKLQRKLRSAARA